jgi:HAD superfamily hydrolase (TIGR01509 family)
MALGAVVWDFDGTLVNSPLAVLAATNAALAGLGFAAISLETVKAGMVLATIPRMASHAGIAAEDPRAVVLSEDFYRHAQREFPLRAVVYPGIADLLRELAARGVPMALVTNNHGAIARATLARAGLADRFTAILGDGDTPSHKPDPRGAWMGAAACGVDPAACAYIGDSAVDRDTARAAGMAAIGVCWGTTPRAGLIGFDALADRPEELLRLIVG